MTLTMRDHAGDGWEGSKWWWSTGDDDSSTGGGGSSCSSTDTCFGADCDYWGSVNADYTCSTMESTYSCDW